MNVEARSQKPEVSQDAAPLLAFCVEIDSMSTIVFAATKPKAQWIAVKGYREAGFGRRGTWPRALAGREPRFDHSPLKERGPRCWSREYVEDCR